MRTAIKCAFGLALVAGLGGCATFDDSSENTAQREDINILREDLSRVKGQMETVELENRRVANEFDKLRAACSDKRDQAAIQERLAGLERQIQAVNEAREKDKQAIVDQLSAKLAEIMSKPAAAARPAHSAAAGNEHVVQPGETLSAIAAAYKVKAGAIIEANNLSDPDHLKAGQRLVIPR